MSEQRLLTTSEVARRLGVKRETVYAYVSRGLLARHPDSGHRATRFDADAVERLAGRARRGDRSAALEVVIETQLTAIDPAGRIAFRGHDALSLARYRSFEDVAGLLWDGDPHAPWTLSESEQQTIGALRVALLPSHPRPADLIPVAVSALAPSDPGRADRRPEAVRRAGARICAGALGVIDWAGADRTTGLRRNAARRVWSALSGGRAPRPAQVSAIDAALVLLADHELAASTLAARVAASAWADPYRVVLAGLGPLGGALHGGAPDSVRAMLAAIPSPEEAFGELEARLSAGAVLGFGHRVYTDRDPRADHLLVRIPGVAVDARTAATVTNVLASARALGLPAPNVDLALAALAYVMELEPGAASAIFTLARIPGLLAHAIEEYPHRLRFRPRATYVGPVPRGA
jgi:citrate synthase